MQSPHRALANGQAPPVARQVGVRSELGGLRASYRSRALVIAALGEAVSRWRRGAAALTAESADPRAVHERLPSGRRAGVRATAGVIDSAPLLGTELLNNSVRHSGAPTAHAVAARVQVTRTTVRLEVEDSGRGGMIARRPPDPERGWGFGRRLVQALSERSGLERVAEGGTRLWAQPRRTTDRDGGNDQHIRRPSLSKPDQPTDGRRPEAAPVGGQP